LGVDKTNRAKMFLLSALALAFVAGCSSPCHDFSFHQAFPGVFVGCRPKKQTDFDRLHQSGIRTIISYETFTWHVAPERQKAQRNKIDFVNVPVFASPIGPSEKTMEQALQVLADKSLRPVYVHCLYGRDRTAMILGLYEVYYQGIPPETAWQQMIRSGYQTDWSLWGFKRYFWNHTHKPKWVDAQSQSAAESRDDSDPVQGRSHDAPEAKK
jgi:protein-tyrosine phosphatase